MAHAIRYFCSWETEVYKHQMRLELWEKDYKGEATAMVLSGEPKLTMEEGDTICGSSLDFGLLSETNGQYLHLYTTDNHKYLIKILRDGAVMWEGYLLPEYYSEAYIAAPYTVSFTATDWLGMLKNIDFPAEDTRVPILQIIKTCLQYTELLLDFACQMELRVEGINDTTNVLGALYLNPITFTGYNCYEVLEKILAAFNATLRQTGHRWLISSIDDELPLRLISWNNLTYTGDGESNNGELIGTNFDGTFIDGSMTMAISPAKKSVDLSQDIFYRESWLKDYDFRSADAWAWPDNTNIVKPGLAYYIQDGVLIEQISVEYLILRTKSTHELPYLSQVINVEGAPDDSEYTLGIKFFTPNLVDGDNITALWVKIINRSSTSLTQDVAYLSKDGWTNEDSYIELNGTSAEAKYISSHTYNRGGRQYLIYDKENWPTTKINFISIPYTGTLEIRIYPMYLAGFTTVINPSYYETYFGGVYLTKTNVTKNLTISSSLNPDAAETASSVNLMLCDSPEERNVELGVLNYFSLSNGALTTGKKWYYNGQEYEDFLHAMAYSYSRCYANKRQKLSGALYTDKIYNLCSFTDKWSGKRHTIKSWNYSIISERLDSMEIIETPAKEIELTLSTPEAGSSNKQNQPSGGTSGGGSTSMAGSGRYVNLDTAQEVSGEKTWNDKATFKKDIVVEGDGIFGGEVSGIVGEGTPAGVTDYSALTGKPSINGKELASGENSLSELGIQPAGNYATESSVDTKLGNYATKTFVSNNYAGKSALNNHIIDSVKHITDEERTAWNNKSDLTAEDVKGIKVNNAGHADSADNATKAGSADKLTNSRKIFGLPFDGTKDVDGGITANGDSVINGNLNVTKDGIFGGEVSGIVGEGTPAGVTDYSALTGKPSINGKELASGDNTLDALGIQPKGDYTTASQLATTLADYAKKVFISNNYATKAAVNTIQALIPATASADNQLADKDFVNSSIATATAEFRGSFTSLDELKATSGNLNDYAFYLHNDSVGNSIVDRYKWTTAGWLYEYTLNNSSFTAEQWAALNSAITATLVQSYNSHLNNSTIHITAAERTAWNNKWNYDEEIIKAVKVNAAVSADYATNAANADTLDDYHASSFYKHATAYPCGSSEKPWHKIATFSQSTVRLQINTSITFYISEFYKSKSYGIFTVRARAEADSADLEFLTVDFLVNAGISKSDIVATWKNTGDGNIVINVYANRAGWSSFSFRKIEEQAWGSPQDKWTTLNASQGNENCYSSIPSDENQVVSTNIDIYNNAASATKLQTPRTLWGRNFDGLFDVSGDLENVGNITASGKATIQGDIISGGEIVAIVGEVTPAGVTDYSALTGKPSINGVTLASGNNTLASLGIQAAGDYATNSGVTTLLANYADKTFVSNNYVGKSAFNNHTADTDIHITAAERVAWNAKWNYDEATIKAIKVTSASSADSVAWTGISGKPTTFTPSAHTHTASEVSGLPTSLKNPYALTFGSKTYDGSAAATITASDLSALTSITKSMVEGVLTGDITSHTHSYLPLTGGTMTGVVTLTSGGSFALEKTALSFINSFDKTEQARIGTNTINDLGLYAIGCIYIRPNITFDGSGLAYGLKISSSSFTYNGTDVSLAGHTHTFASLTSKPTTLSGYGITDAYTATTIDSKLSGYLPLSGGTLTGALVCDYALSNNSRYTWRNSRQHSGEGGRADNFIRLQKADGTFNASFSTFGEAETDSYIYVGYDKNYNGLNLRIGPSSLSWGDNPILHSGNYNSYTPTLTGTGASGTWGISISGNAASATKLATPRNIWGQSFDGTSDVNGDAHITGDLIVDGEVSALVA